MRLFRLLVSIAAVVSAGCTLHTEVTPGFDWSAVSAVALQEPEADRWGLLPEVRRELREMGYEILPASTAGKLRARFHVEETRDIDEAGAVFSRPKSLHIQFFDPSGTPMATGDYVLGASENPEWGVRALFAALRKRQGRQGAAADSSLAALSFSSQGEAPAELGAPQRHSPWVPRFQSWGTEEWGKPQEVVTP